MDLTQSSTGTVPHIISEQTLLYIFIPLVLLWGIIDCFYGFRFFKFTVVCGGALLLGYIGTRIAPHYFEPGIYSVIGGFALGVIVGIVFSWFLYKLETFLIGVAVGMFLAMSFFPHVSELQLGVTCLGGFVGGIFMFMCMDVMVIAITSITGALRIVLCIACYTGSVAIKDVYELIEGDSVMNVWYHWNLDIRYVLAMLVLLLLGFMAQYSRYRKDKHD